MNDDDILDQVFKTEGGFVNSAADPGGATNHGVTLATLSKARGHAVSVAEVQALGQKEAREILRQMYLRDPGFDRLTDPVLRWIMVDCAVLHGQSNAVKLLQRALGVEDDGVLGLVTRAAANAADARRTALRVAAQRERLLSRIERNRLTDNDKDGVPDGVQMAPGWHDRNARFIEALA